jgi:hypothetical protein
MAGRRRAFVVSAMRSLVLVTLASLASLVCVASAESCTLSSGVISGTFEGPYDAGTFTASVSFPSEISPGVMSISGSAHSIGSSKLGFGSFNLGGPYTNGTISCSSGAEQFSIPWTGVLYGKLVSNFPAAYTGTAYATFAEGKYEDVYEGVREEGVWKTTSYPSGQSQGTQPGPVGVINPPGTQVSAFAAEPIKPSQLPPNVVAPAGAIAFSVNEVPALGTISVTLVLPPGSGPTQVYKSANGVYEPYPPSKTKINGNEITLELTDNEVPWDENPAAGVIRDPVVPVEPQVGTPPTITGLSPKKAPAGAKTPVTITGTGFTAATVVRFG